MARALGWHPTPWSSAAVLGLQEASEQVFIFERYTLLVELLWMRLFWTSPPR
jgi:hypothetical protein